MSNTPSVHHRLIGDRPYVFTRNEWGWAVCADGTQTDRFYRNYQVYLSPGGRPLRCSCASCTRAGKWCKHLRAVEAIINEENKMATRKRPEQGKPKRRSVPAPAEPPAAAGDWQIQKNADGSISPVSAPTSAGSPPATQEPPTGVLRNLSTARFEWHPDKRVFSTEASSLPSFQCEEVVVGGKAVPGFRLRSAKTGAETLVALSREQRDAERELQWREFRPVDRRLHDDFVVVIYND